MPYSSILFETDGNGIAVLTVNRPDKMNALNRAVLGEISEAVAQCEHDATIRALIVTGAGEKAFVAGADIAELASLTPLETRARALDAHALLRRIERLPKVTVAAINGFALGGGLELAMACAVRFCSPNAKLGQPEVKIGVIPGFGGTQRLPRIVGRGRALELLLSGDPVDATEAHRIGLVNAVALQAELLEFAREWVSKTLANAPLALALTMEAVDAGLNSGLEEGLRFEALGFGLVAATQDRREGMSAFLEKRKAAFVGK
jgi:enoyl-CoA hydratase